MLAAVPPRPSTGRTSLGLGPVAWFGHLFFVMKMNAPEVDFQNER